MTWTEERHEEVRARCKAAMKENGLYMYLFAAYDLADLPDALNEIERLEAELKRASDAALGHEGYSVGGNES